MMKPDGPSSATGRFGGWARLIRRTPSTIAPFTRARRSVRDSGASVVASRARCSSCGTVVHASERSTISGGRSVMNGRRGSFIVHRSTFAVRCSLFAVRWSCSLVADRRVAGRGPVAVRTAGNHDPHDRTRTIHEQRPANSEQRAAEPRSANCDAYVIDQSRLANPHGAGQQEGALEIDGGAEGLRVDDHQVIDLDAG